MIARRLAQLAGSYVHQGDELFVVGDEQRKELRVALHQDDVDRALPCLQHSVRFRGGGGELFQGALQRLAPRQPAIAASGDERRGRRPVGGAAR